MTLRIFCPFFTFAFACAALAKAEPIFLEAETFSSGSVASGWTVAESPQTRAASGLKTLNGAAGDVAAVATKQIEIPAPGGEYRVWVRHIYHGSYRGPFVLSISREEGAPALAEKVFDQEVRPEVRDWSYVWDFVDVTLAPGPVDLSLSKYDSKNCSGYVRHVDCLLLTTDKKAQPDHIPYGPKTWLRVTLSEDPGIYREPVQIHVFADHYRYPWYSHWHLSKLGALAGLDPPSDQRLVAGEATPWCDITAMLYQDSGAILNVSARYSYSVTAPRLKARFEFATEPREEAVVRRMDVDSKPGGLVVVAPPNLVSEENRSRLKRDSDFAEATGKLADAFAWPTFGKKPVKIPFFVSATVGGYGTAVDDEIEEREWKTLNYFGFSNRDLHDLHGTIWKRKNDSFCEPDLAAMTSGAEIEVKEFFERGGKVADIAYCMLTDEPTGQDSEFLAKDPAYHAAFRVWLRDHLKLSPADLLVADWESVKPVSEKDRDRFPGLHYYTQRFRTRALGDFMEVQRGILEKAYGTSLPTLVNFSDGATYTANFYSQGVDYFELLDDDGQNSIWSEDWANGASSYQCGAFNVDLMRAAAKDRGQSIGHYLIAHAGRKSWDIKTKAASETARGVRLWKNFSYGVSWGSHEGGPAWRSHTWYSKPDVWRANAEVVREIGAVEDLLIGAKAKPAEVAILYASSSDIWALKQNYAQGFDRMHTWMALAHAQIPVDFVAERQVERGGLDGYRVCYLSGENLTQAAANQLKGWIEGGGTLYLTAGAASLDEFNRPLDGFETILPVKRDPVKTLQPFLSSGSYLQSLVAKDTVRTKEDATTMEVLSVKQTMSVRDGNVEVLATFASDNSPAIVRGAVGKGTLFLAGFLPALDYIKQAEVARRGLLAKEEKTAADSQPDSDHPAPPVELAGNRSEKAPGTDPRLERSYNPWEYSGPVREQILAPVRYAKISPALTCDIALVDAILLEGESGAVIPLSNFTLAPLKEVTFTLRSKQEVDRIESVHRGAITWIPGAEKGTIRFSLPLEASDYLMVFWKR